MFTPKQLADRLGLSGTTIRNYSRLWSDYLSPSANPEAGQARLYTDDDIAVIVTIAALRDNQATTDQIRAALDAGQRLEPMRPPEADQPTADPDPQAGAAQQARAAVEAAAATAEKQIAIYRDRVTAVEARADQLTDRLIEAEKRAAAAESAIAVNRERVSQLEARADQLADQARADQARAAAAEKELEVLRELYEAATSPAPGSTRPTY